MIRDAASRQLAHMREESDHIGERTAKIDVEIRVAARCGGRRSSCEGRDAADSVVTP